MPRDVREVANAVLDCAEGAGYRLTNLALNKVVYFVHAWFLAQYAEPLVDSKFEAWQYGPVHPQIYRQMKRFREQPIDGRLTKIDLDSGEDVPFAVCLSEREREVVERVTLFYARHSASKLVQISHEPGAPWDQVWSSAESTACPGMEIPDQVTESYYRGKLAKRS